jgi:hypothetical protein
LPRERSGRPIAPKGESKRWSPSLLRGKGHTPENAKGDRFPPYSLPGPPSIHWCGWPTQGRRGAHGRTCGPRGRSSLTFPDFLNFHDAPALYTCRCSVRLDIELYIPSEGRCCGSRSVERRETDFYGAGAEDVGDAPRAAHWRRSPCSGVCGRPVRPVRRGNGGASGAYTRRYRITFH